MKIRAYIRIGKNGYKYKVDAGTKENQMPLFIPNGYHGEIWKALFVWAMVINAVLLWALIDKSREAKMFYDKYAELQATQSACLTYEK